MSVISELPERVVEECVWEGKEKAKNKCLRICGGIADIDGMPRLKSLSFGDSDIRFAVKVPLTGDREMLLWIKVTEESNWYDGRTDVVAKLLVDNSRGEPGEDVVVINKKREFVSVEKDNDPVGLKFFARFDPKRDIDEAKLDGSELQKKVVEALRGDVT
jgi:hypothetical protein